MLCVILQSKPKGAELHMDGVNTQGPLAPEVKAPTGGLYRPLDFHSSWIWQEVQPESAQTLRHRKVPVRQAITQAM